MKHHVAKYSPSFTETRRLARCPYALALRELRAALGEIHRDQAARFPEWTARVKVSWKFVYQVLLGGPSQVIVDYLNSGPAEQRRDMDLFISSISWINLYGVYGTTWQRENYKIPKKDSSA